MRPPSQDHPELDFDRLVDVLPVADPSEVEALVSYLLGKGWVTAREIIQDAPGGVELPGGDRGMEKAKRKLRRLAEIGRDHILAYPGSKGYRALVEASMPEIQHGIRAHRSQARRHISASVALQRYQHSHA